MKVQFNFGMSHFPCKHCVTSCFFCLCNNGENRSYLRFRRSIGFSPFSFAWSVCLAPFFHSIDLWAKAQGFLEQPTNTKSTHAETSPSTEMSSNHSWRLKKSGKLKNHLFADCSDLCPAGCSSTCTVRVDNLIVKFNTLF